MTYLHSIDEIASLEFRSALRNYSTNHLLRHIFADWLEFHNGNENEIELFRRNVNRVRYSVCGYGGGDGSDGYGDGSGGDSSGGYGSGGYGGYGGGSGGGYGDGDTGSCGDGE